MTLTQKQEAFTRNLFEGMSQRVAYVAAGYSSNQSPATIDRHASELAKNDKVMARYEKLRQKAEDASVATVLERKQILTEIARARMTDFLTCSADGVWMHDIGQDSMNTAALKKVETTTAPFGNADDNLKIILTKVELIDPTKAIDLLNKMDKLYEAGISNFQDNRQINIYIQGNDAKKKLERLLSGEKRKEGLQDATE